MFHTYGEFIARRSKIMLGLAGLALVVAGVLGFGAFGKLKAGGFDDPAADSSRAQRVIEAEYGGQVNLVLLVEAKAATVDAPESPCGGSGVGLGVGRGIDGDQRRVVLVDQGAKSQVGRRFRGAGARPRHGGRQPDREPDRGAHREVHGRSHAAISVRAGGDAAANHDVTSEVARSLAIAEAIAIPVTLLLLVLAFGSMVAASLPLAIGGVAILGTFAELFVLGSVADVSVFAINLTTALGLGLGIDYALLLVARFREQVATGQSAHDAVVRTVETAGRTIVFSAGTVAAALAALLVFPLFFLRSFAYAGIGVVAIAAVAALVVVPALLAILGHRVNSGRLPWSRTIRSGSSALWGRIAATVMRRPAIAAMPVLVALLVAASPLLGASFGTPDQGVLPARPKLRLI